jgi:hypothetical protein
VVEVRLAGESGVLEVLLNQEVLSFTEQNWMDLKGEWCGQERSAGCLRAEGGHGAFMFLLSPG